MRIIHIAIESIVRMAAVLRPFKRCHAAEAPTSKAVERYAAMVMCASRKGKEGLNITSTQFTGTTRPFTIEMPCGVCIQLLEARIHVVEINVPIATITVAAKCNPGPTRFLPKSITPKNPASRKNAVSTS